MPYAPTDWNVHLGITPPPEGTLDESQLPEVEPYGGVQLSQWGEVPLETASEFYRMAAIRRKEQEASREAAIRWQGEKQYESMIARGASPEEAFQKTAHLMYYNHPAGIGSLMRATELSKPSMPKYYHIGDQLVELDPNKRTATPLFTAPSANKPIKSGNIVLERDEETGELVPTYIPPDKSATFSKKYLLPDGSEVVVRGTAKQIEEADRKYNPAPPEEKPKETTSIMDKIQRLMGLAMPGPKTTNAVAAPTPPTFPVDSLGVGPPMPGAVNPVQNVGPLTMPTSAPPVAATAPAPAAAPLPLPPFTNAPVAPPELGGPVDVDPKLQKIINMQKDEQRILRMMEQGQQKKAAEAPKATEVPAAPPKAQRVKGQVYLTPKGDYRWTGDGWEEP